MSWEVMIDEKSLLSSISKRYLTKSLATLETQENWIGLEALYFTTWLFKEVGWAKLAGASGGVTSVDLEIVVVLVSVLPALSTVRTLNLYKASLFKTAVVY